MSGKQAGGRVWLKTVFGAGGMAALMAYSSGACHRRTEPGTVEAPAGAAVPAEAKTFVVRRAPAPVLVEVVGTVESEERISLSARIPAHVSRVSASAGTPVKAGQELIALDDREIVEQLAAAEAMLRQAETEYNRAKQLIASEAITKQALIAAESQYQAANAQVARVKVMMSYTKIASPIDGIVTDRRVEEGDLAAPGQVLMAVYDPRRMRLEAPVPVRLVDRVPLGRKARVTLQDPERTVEGTVTGIVGEIDPMTRTRKVKVSLGGAAGEVLPGAFGRLCVEAGEEPAVWIPESAVIRTGQLEMVQVVEKGRALRRLVQTGPRRDAKIEILGGLDDGETVLAEPLREVRT